MSHGLSLHVEQLEATYLDRLSSFTNITNITSLTASCLLHVPTSAATLPRKIISSILLYIALNVFLLGFF